MTPRLPRGCPPRYLTRDGAPARVQVTHLWLADHAPPRVQEPWCSSPEYTTPVVLACVAALRDLPAVGYTVDTYRRYQVKVWGPPGAQTRQARRRLARLLGHAPESSVWPARTPRRGTVG